ncbi:MAG TPA: DAK2 domain-containing protein [Ktedonobacterales bacterium]|nr:DAK2 domain-containing protein [Ktedonobacterales bacterium]
MAKSFFSRFTSSRPKQISVFDGQDLKRAVLAGQAWLEQHREAINALNVFPVPDGDTGTNMTLTMRAATKDIIDSPETSASAIAAIFSRGALMGARGNSGVILSQILRGISKGLDSKTTFTAVDFAAALQESARLAYSAVIKPVEGTILTVIRECAEAAQQSAANGSNLSAMLGDTVRAAHASVARTPDLLPTLKQAGVVDAGGQGLATILEGVWRYSRGESLTMSAREHRQEAAEAQQKGMVTVEEEFGYEVVFLLEGDNLDVDSIRQTIIDMGGVSTVVAGDKTLLKVHTHTPTPGKILDYGVGLGSLQDINIENLQAQSLRYAAESARERGVAMPDTARAVESATLNGRSGGGTSAAVATPVAAPPAEELRTGDIGTVAVAAGDGWVELFQSLGVSNIVPGGQTMNPSTQELLEAVQHCPASKVILLPNNGNVIMSARQVPELANGKEVYVVPSDSLPQGVGALLAFNFEADFPTNCHEMEQASKRVQTAEITRAVRTVQIDGVNVTEGDIIGLVNNRLVTAGTDRLSVVRDTLTRMNVGQYEIVTLYSGDGITSATASEMAQHIKGWFPAQEIEVVRGGQPYYDYIISAE